MESNESFDEFCDVETSNIHNELKLNFLLTFSDVDAWICFGCRETLSTSRTIVSVSGYHKWHSRCLSCADCGQSLFQLQSCYIHESNMPMEHLDNDQTSPNNHQLTISTDTNGSNEPGSTIINGGDSLTPTGGNIQQQQQQQHQQQRAASSNSSSNSIVGIGLNCSGTGTGTGTSSSSSSKTKRVRTTFTEDQLSILHANFQLDSNPDGQDLERIANLTGLTKRVTQVWFQNSRARQKKYMNKGHHHHHHHHHHQPQQQQQQQSQMPGTNQQQQQQSSGSINESLSLMDFCSFWILFLDTSQLGFKDQDSRKKEKNTKNKCKHLPNNLSVQNVLVSYGNNILGVRKIGSEQEKKIVNK
ncbi:LIM/homeobox protein Lhx8 [Blomia tropicalis]|nr:LIM/homeobox protein Lhx8 [Blomia tropicalis]